MLTKVIKGFCSNTSIVAHKITKCVNFTALPSSKCYAIGYPEWKKIFQKEHKNYILDTIKNSESYFFHVWNGMRKLSNDLEEELDPDSAYMELAKKYCPKVYESLLKS